jgi:hypothetical protein
MGKTWYRLQKGSVEIMHGSHLAMWWHGLSGEAKAAIIAAVVASSLGAVYGGASWLLTKRAPRMLENFYLRLLEEYETKYKTAYYRLFARMVSTDITQELIEKEMGKIRHPWFTKRALKWRNIERLRVKHTSLPDEGPRVSLPGGRFRN